MNPKSIWLTGSSGLVGRSILDHLHDVGADVLPISNQLNANFPNKKDGNRAYVNYSETDSIKDFSRRFSVPETLIHAGWGAMSNADSLEHLNQNVENSLNLMRTLFKLGLQKFIFLGSINEYGERNGCVSECMTSLGKQHNYALGKQQVREIGLSESYKYNAVYIHVRIANVYGAPQKHGSLISDLHQAYQRDEPARLSDCSGYRDYIHNKDVAEAIRRLCQVNATTTVNVGSGNSVQVRDFVEQYWSILGGNRKNLLFGASNRSQQSNIQPIYMDLSRLEQLTGWKPISTLEERLRETIIDMNKLSTQL